MKKTIMNSINSTGVYVYIIAVLTVLLQSCKDDDNMLEQDILEHHIPQLKSINIEGFDITYLEGGNSNSENTIILLHGIPSNSLLFRNIVTPLAEATNFRVIAPDLLGFGQSSKPEDETNFSFVNQGDLIYKLGEALGVDHFILGLHDAGGPIGWSMMLDKREARIEGLLITNTTLEFEGFNPPDPMIPIFTGMQTPEEVFPVLLADEGSRLETTRQFFEPGMSNAEARTETLYEAYAATLTHPTSFIGLFNSLNEVLSRTPEIKQAMANFNRPVHILWGGDDPILTAPIIPNKLKDDFDLSDDQVTILSNASHYLQEDRPQKYVEEVSEFLNNNF